MRCLTLADYLVKTGHQTLFIGRGHAGNLAQFIHEQGHKTVLLSATGPSVEGEGSVADEYASWLGVSQERDAEDTGNALRNFFPAPDWLVVDHYALDKNWHAEMRPHVGSVFVIDDLANRPHDCDMLLDQNLSRGGSSRYNGLVPDHCIRFIGPEYALLREEFITQRATHRKRDGSVRKVLVFFGGVDPSSETLKTCHALSGFAGERFTVTVIVGMANPHRDEIEAFCSSHRGFTFFGRVGNMAALMTEADLAIGAGGTTTWERAYLGLPTIAVWIAENQREGTEAMAEAGALWNLGRGQDVAPGHITNALEHALSDPAGLKKMSERAQSLFGDAPEPAAVRVIRLMQENLHV
jgi:UDP-2,4-diacetamido-2,4,6-trideoxy-beta-L-altropyranose hydrolase